MKTTVRYIITHIRLDTNGIITDLRYNKEEGFYRRMNLVNTKHNFIQNIIVNKQLFNSVIKTYDGVHVKIINNNYLRTDGNNINQDNLINIPIF